MNTLQLIKKQINKASAVHDAQITHTAYRGVKCEVHKPVESQSFCTWSHLCEVTWEHYKSLGSYPWFAPIIDIRRDQRPN